MTSSNSMETIGFLRPASSFGAVRDELEVFFVNCTVIDASLAVYDKVHDKFSKPNKSPNSIREKVACAIASKAAKIVTSQSIASKLSEKIPKLLMYKLSDHGLQLLAETVFMEDTFFVVQLQVQYANPALLLESLEDDDNETDNDDNDSVETVVLDEWMEQMEKDAQEQVRSQNVFTSRMDAKLLRKSPLSRSKTCPARWLDWILSKCSSAYRKRIESRYLPILIQRIIISKMDKIIRKKFNEKNVVAETQVLREQEQARYFFDHLNELRNSKD